MCERHLNTAAFYFRTEDEGHKDSRTLERTRAAEEARLCGLSLSTAHRGCLAVTLADRW